MSAESLQNVRPRPGQGERILLVDDDPDARESLMRRLTRRGYQVDTVEGASQALDALQKDCFDLMLLDHNMPGMTGLEMLPKVKEIRPDVPIIMITAYGDADTRRKATEGGAIGLLTKPIDFTLLRSEIDARIGQAA